MIFTIAGSNSSVSINQEVAKEISKNLCCFYYDTRRINIPVYNRDLKVISEISNLYNLICEYNTIIFVVPEYNGSLSSFFKNIVDELSIYNKSFLSSKQVFIVSATPGSRGGASVLEKTGEMFKHFGANIVSTYGIANYESLSENISQIEKICEDIKKRVM
ncbi:MAG: NADPH-dependent FMN reductase [Bacilli bacterium]